jgi:hypothetical protein
VKELTVKRALPLRYSSARKGYAPPPPPTKPKLTARLQHHALHSHNRLFEYIVRSTTTPVLSPSAAQPTRCPTVRHPAFGNRS